MKQITTIFKNAAGWNVRLAPDIARQVGAESAPLPLTIDCDESEAAAYIQGVKGPDVIIAVEWPWPDTMRLIRRPELIELLGNNGTITAVSASDVCEVTYRDGSKNKLFCNHYTGWTLGENPLGYYSMSLTPDQNYENST